MEGQAPRLERPDRRKATSPFDDPEGAGAAQGLAPAIVAYGDSGAEQGIEDGHRGARDDVRLRSSRDRPVGDPDPGHG